MQQKDKLSKLCKGHMVDEIKTRMKSRPNFVLTNYMGSSVSDLELLRKNLKKASGSYFVVKNSILKVILDEFKMEDMSKMIDGGMGVSLCGDDLIVSCKELVTFAKSHDKFKIKAAFLDGKMMPADKVNAIASLPAREILLSQIVGGIKSPITGFVNVLGGVIRKFVYCVDAIKAQKEKAAPVASPSAPAAQEPAKPAPETPAPAATPAPQAGPDVSKPNG